MLIGWGWYKVTYPSPICQVQEQIDGKTVFVPKPCADLIKKNEGYSMASKTKQPRGIRNNQGERD